MVRSMTKRGMPKPFAILIAALLALYFVPFGAMPAQAATSRRSRSMATRSTTPGGPADRLGDFTPAGDRRRASRPASTTPTVGQDDTTFQGAQQGVRRHRRVRRWPSGPFGSPATRPASRTSAAWATVHPDRRRRTTSWFFFAFDRGFGERHREVLLLRAEPGHADPDHQRQPDPHPGRHPAGQLRPGQRPVTLHGGRQNEDVGLYVWDDRTWPARTRVRRRRQDGFVGQGRRRRLVDPAGLGQSRCRLVDRRQHRPTARSPKDSSSSPAST